LAAGLVEDVDEMALDVEQAEFEHGEQPAWPGADDEHVSLDGIGHCPAEVFCEEGCVASARGGEKSAFGLEMQDSRSTAAGKAADSAGPGPNFALGEGAFGA
jgi:hypothetical protein